MDELALLKDMADGTPLPSAADLAPARARLTAAFSHPTQLNHVPLNHPTQPDQPALNHSTQQSQAALNHSTPLNHAPLNHPTQPDQPALSHPTQLNHAALNHSTPPSQPALNQPTPLSQAALNHSTQPDQSALNHPAEPSQSALSRAASLNQAALSSQPTRPNQKDAPLTVHIDSTQPSQHDDKVTSVVDRPRRGRRRLVVSAVAVVGLAAAITGVVALGGLESVGVAPPKASATEILHQAADAARQQPAAVPPRPDQFVYSRSQNSDGSVREAWLSADGTHDGLIAQEGERIPLPGCRDGKMAVIKGTEPIPGMFESCTPRPSSLTDLPTDAAGMREYLKQAGGDPEDTNSVNKNIMFVAETYVSPESLAALFEVMADLPGLTVDEHATDGAGRPGTGVSWTDEGHTMTLVFDPETHVFLGVAGWNAVVERGVVDTAGQRP